MKFVEILNNQLQYSIEIITSKFQRVSETIFLLTFQNN